MKRRRRQEVPTSVDVVSSKKTQSMELSEFQDPTKGKIEAREGSNKVDSLSLGTIIDLVEISMTSKSSSECFVIFKVFVRVISTKFDTFDITKSRAEQSFIFCSCHIIQVDFLLFSLSILFTLFFF